MSQSKSWKFGVFSLIALMLTMGLFAGSALAAISANTPAGRIPAGSQGNTITLNISGIDTTATKGPITIAPPASWSSMQTANNNTEGFTTGVTVHTAGLVPPPTGGIVIDPTATPITVIYGDTSISSDGGATANPVITSSGVFTIKQFTTDGATVASQTTVPIITAAEGSGAITPLAQSVLGGKTGLSFEFTYRAIGNIGENVDQLNGGTFEIVIPAGWSDPNGRISRETPDPDKVDSPASDGPGDAANVGSIPTITGSGPWTVSFSIIDMDGGDILKIKYTNVTAPIASTDPTPYTFTTRIAPLGRSPRQLVSGSPVVTVTKAGKGTGTISVVSGGRLTANSDGNTLAFRYTAAGTLTGGRMVIKRPTTGTWPVPQVTSGGAGATAISFPNGGSGTVIVTKDDDKGFVADDINIIIDSLIINQVIQVTYANVKAPSTLGTHIFSAFVTPDSKINTAEAATKLDPSPDVTVQVGDGQGDIGVKVVRTNSNQSNAGEKEKVEFTFAAVGTMDGGELSLTIDNEWPDLPTSGNTEVASLPGATGTAVFIGRTITIPIVALSNTQTVTIKYGKNDDNKVTAPPEPKTGDNKSKFIFKSKGTPSGVLTQVKNPLEIEVLQAKDGSGSATISFVSGTMPGVITAGGTNNQVTIVYKAVGRMDGGTVLLFRPQGWTDFKDSDGVIHISIVSTGTVGAQNIQNDRAIIDLVSLGKDGTVTFAYTGAKAQPNALDNVPFTVQSRGSKSENPMQPIGTQPTLNVKRAADGSGTATIAIEGTTQGASASAAATTTQTFRLVYTGIGTMDTGTLSMTVPTNFSALTLVTPPATPTADGQIQVITGTGVALVDPTPPATTSIIVFGRTVTVPIKTLGADGTISFLYITNVGSTKNDFPFDFKTRGSSEDGRSLVTLPPTLLPKVTVTNVPDGSGTAEITIPAKDTSDGDKRKLPVKAANQTIKFVFTAPGPMSGGAIELTAEDNRWPKPGGPTGTNSPTDPGFIQVTPSGNGEIGPYSFGPSNVLTATIPIVSLVKDETLTIEYRNVTVPDAAGTYRFPIKSKGSSGGAFAELTTSGKGAILDPTGTLLHDTVKLQIVATSLEGSGTIEVFPKYAFRGDKKTYTFTYTAKGPIKALTISLPTGGGWSTIQTSNSTGDGFLSLLSSPRGGTLSGGGNAISFTNLALNADERVVVEYRNAVAPTPSSPTAGDFAVFSSADNTAPTNPSQKISGSGGSVFVTAKVSESNESGKVVANQVDPTTPGTSTTVTLKNVDNTEVRATGKATIRFVYKADGFIKDGELEIGVPSGWTTLPTTGDARGKVTVFRTPDPTSDAVDDPSITNVSGGSILVAIPRLEATQTVTVVYGGEKSNSDNNTVNADRSASAPAASANSGFVVRLRANPSDTRLAIRQNEISAGNAQVVVNVKSAPSGTGSFAYTGPTTVNSGSVSYRFIFTYVAGGTMNNGAIRVAIPMDASRPAGTDWSPPTLSDVISVRGKVTATSDGDIDVNNDGSPDITFTGTLGNEINVGIETLRPGERIIITYGSGTDREPKVQGAKATGDNKVFFLTQARGGESGDAFAIVGPAKDGKLLLTVENGADGSGSLGTVTSLKSPITAASGGNQLTFTYAAVGDMSGGAVRLIPGSGWTVPQGAATIAGFTVIDPISTAETLGTPQFDNSSRSFIVPIVTMTAGTTIVIKYGSGGGSSGAVATNAKTDTSNFTIQSKGSSGGTFTQVSQPSVAITNVADGAGKASTSVSTVKAGSPDNIIAFTYTAAGTIDGGAIRMLVPDGWTAPTVTAAGDGGNTTVTSSGTKGSISLDPSNTRKVLVPITTLGGGGTVTLTYKGNAQPTKNTDPKVQFTFESDSGEDGTTNRDFAVLTSSATASGSGDQPLVSVTEAADGSGTVNVDLKVVKKSEKRTYNFTYTPVGTMTENGEIRIAVPSTWPTPPQTGDPGADGFFSGSSTNASVTYKVSGREMIATIGTTPLVEATTPVTFHTVTFQYKNAPAPSVSIADPFTTQTKGNKDGVLTAIGTSPVVTVSKEGDGSGAISVTPTSVRAASKNTLTFTYTASEQMTGGELSITPPAGWTKAKDAISTTAGVDVTISGGNLGSIFFEDADQTVVIGIANLSPQSQVTVKYNNATAQNTVGTAIFVTKTRVSQAGTRTAAQSLLDRPSQVTVDKVNDGTGTAAYVGDAIAAASSGNQLTFDFTAAGTMDTGAISLTVPSSWTLPQGTQFQPGYTIVTTPQGGSVGNSTFSGQTITVPINTLGPSQKVRIVYGSGSGSSGVQSQLNAGGATFIVKSRGKSGGELKNISDAPNNALQPVVVVINARDGSGTMSVSPPSVTAGSVATLTFTYVPAGTIDGGAVSITVPQGWPNPTSTNTTVPSESGAQFGTLDVSSEPGTVKVPIIALTSGQRVRIQYTVTVPATLDTVRFITKSRGSQTGQFLELDAGSPSVTVGGAADGSGTVTVTSVTTPVTAGSTGNEIRILYRAAGPMANGAISVDLPAGWSPREGQITVDSTGTINSAGVTFTGGIVTVPITNLNVNQTITLTYSNAKAQGNAGNAVFRVKSKGSGTGQLVDVTQGSFTVTVDNAADGSGTAAISPDTVVLGSSNNLRLTYTAVGSISNGRLRISIPAGWTIGTVDTSSSEGIVQPPEVSGTSIGVTITTLAATQRAVILINNATAPSTLGVSPPFTVELRSSGGTFKPLATSPSITVNVAASVLAISSTPQTVSKGVVSGPITIVTRDADGKPATSTGGVTVNLSSSNTSTGAFDTSATGAFNGTVISVLIPAGATSVQVFYKDPTAGTATLTATVASFPEATRTATQSITISEPPAPPTVLAISSAGTVFEGDALPVTITLRDVNGNAAASASDVTVSLLSNSTTGTFEPATVTIKAGTSSATVFYKDTKAGTATLTASATGFTSGTHDVTVNSGVISVTVSGSPVKAGGTAAVTAIGKPGATVSFSIGNIVTDKTMTESAAGTYTGTFSPVVDVHVDGTYDVVVKIGSSSLTKTGGVVIDNTAPTLTVTPSATTTIKNGQTLALEIKSEPGLTVKADVSALDTTQKDVALVESATEAGVYRASVVISDKNTAANGVHAVTINATDAAGNVRSVSVSVDLRNGAEFELSVPKDISLIHIPLNVTEVNGQTKAIKTVSALYDALGGSANVNFIITRDTSAGAWRSYLGDQNKGTALDREITADLGLITVMKNAVAVLLKGDALGTDGKSQITLKRGTNLVGVPLKNANLKRVSDLLSLTGIKDNATSIIVSDKGAFKVVTRPDDPGDISITGGQSFIVTARADGVAEVTGEAWDNVSSRASAAPPMALVGLRVDTQTPVLEVHGTVVDGVKGVAKDGFRVSVKNLSTGASLNTLSGSETSDARYSITFVESSGRAAQVGDILEISVDTQNPLIGVQPLRHIVTTDDVKASQIQLENLITYEIPKETKLLPNYPNPFNPETWVPYRLAKDSSVTLTIYDTMGKLVRTIQVGYKPAAVYESRDKAIYWDGRNNNGERVASGIYFYNLTAKDFTATRKMVILK